MQIVRSGWLRATTALALLCAIALFIARRALASANSVEGDALRDDAGWFALAIALFMLATLCLAGVWIALIESVEPEAPRRRGRLVLAFSYSWLGRYIPGTLPFFAGKVYLGSRLGYGTRPLVVTTGVQNVLEIIVSTIVGATMIVAAQGMTAGGGRYLALAFLPSLALVSLHRPFLTRIVDTALRLLRREPLSEGSLPPTRTIALASSGVVANQVCNGIALWLILRAVGTASIDDVFLATGALSLAGVAGMLVVLVPAGLGVRDGALTALLAARFTVEVAAVAAITLRLMTVIADVLLFLVALAIDLVSGTHIALNAVRGRPQIHPVPPPPLPAAASVASERRSA